MTSELVMDVSPQHSVPRDVVDVSICMVSLNAWSVLTDCLASIYASDPSVTYEIIVVDNGSTDDTKRLIAQHHPDVVFVANKQNIGFTRATNQAIGMSSGRYILWLNTDTILRYDTLRKLVSFLDDNPRVGVVGPKVLNADGSFQPQCRRGMPTPLSSLSYMIGLPAILPNSRLANGYLLSHLPNDREIQVAGVSGACLLARRALWEDIGPLDERIFGFGEDLDWCVRAAAKGWGVYYTPSAELTHLKGQGGAHSKPYHKIWGIHQAMWIFYTKHLASQYPGIVNGLVRTGIGLSLTGAIVRTALTRALKRITALV
jgi:GT2 family glycosyltransferase